MTLAAAKHVRPLKTKASLLEKRKLETKVVHLLRRVDPRSTNVRLDGNLVDVVEEGRVLAQNVARQGHLASFTVKLHNVNVLQSEKETELGHRCGSPVLGSALVDNTLLVVTNQTRTDIVKGHFGVKLAWVMHGRVACEAAASPLFRQAHVKGRVVVDAK